MPLAAIARLSASNICVEPTEMPWMLARRPMIRPGLSSVAGAAEIADHADLAADAQRAERARQRALPADLDHVIDAAAYR